MDGVLLRDKENTTWRQAEMGTGAGSIEEEGFPVAYGGRTALLVSGLQGCGRIHFCLFIYLLAIKLGIFFFFMATSGLLRSDQQSWIITGFFILKGPPKYFGCGTSEVLFSTL